MTFAMCSFDSIPQAHATIPSAHPSQELPKTGASGKSKLKIAALHTHKLHPSKSVTSNNQKPQSRIPDHLQQSRFAAKFTYSASEIEKDLGSAVETTRTKQRAGLNSYNAAVVSMGLEKRKKCLSSNARSDYQKTVSSPDFAAKGEPHASPHIASCVESTARSKDNVVYATYHHDR